MTTFLDTSALLAVVDADDLHHSRADAVWKTSAPYDVQELARNRALLVKDDPEEDRLPEAPGQP